MFTIFLMQTCMVSKWRVGARTLRHSLPIYVCIEYGSDKHTRADKNKPRTQIKVPVRRKNVGSCLPFPRAEVARFQSGETMPERQDPGIIHYLFRESDGSCLLLSLWKKDRTKKPGGCRVNRGRRASHLLLPCSA